MEIGFIGVGAMGSRMAKTLLKAGHHLRVWNRSAVPVEALEGESAERAPSPEAAFDADAVVTMLSNDAAIRSVILADLPRPPTRPAGRWSRKNVMSRQASS